MDIQQLQYFLAAAEHGSFSAAARSLRLSQPSISEQVRQLESELGVDLFVRAGRGVVLTEAGRRLRPEAERVVLALGRARDTVRDVRELRGGTLSFGLFGSPSPLFVADIVADFRRRHPDVRLRIVGVNSSEVAAHVREGRLEAGLVVLPVDDEGLELRPARREEIVYVSGEPSRAAEPITPERLAEAPLILYEARFADADPTRRQLLERAQRAGVTLRPVVELESMQAAIALAARGFGDTVVPRAALRRLGLRRPLHAVPFAEPLYDTIAFIARREAPVSPATRAFVEITERRLREVGEGVIYAAPPALEPVD